MQRRRQRQMCIRDSSRTAKSVKIPFTVGGGIDSVSSIKNLLRAGADKVSLNSSAVRNPDLISESSREFGTQCIVIAIDARRKVNRLVSGRYM